MKGPSPQRLWKYIARCLRLQSYLASPGDGRTAPQITGYRHHLAMVSVVGIGLTLPFDGEPYGPRDSEYAAAQRLLRRSLASPVHCNTS